MDSKNRVLLAEDEKALQNIVSIFLSKNGFTVDVVDNGDDACLYVDKNRYDAILLDIMMPGKDGRAVCKYIRSKYDVPVIFLTALGAEKDIVEGYEIGADEYVTKPFSTKLLLLKINAMINRYRGLLVKEGKVVVDELLIEPARRSVSVDGKRIELAPKEYDLLMFFLENKERVLSRETILDKVWGADFEGYDRAVDTHVKKLRATLGKASYHIETVIKSGYVWKCKN